MAEPVIAANKPMVVDLAAGDYWWCACGQSKTQPWCDGSHKGSEFSPVKYELKEAKRVAMCCCKRTNGAPICDGQHKNL